MKDGLTIEGFHWTPAASAIPAEVNKITDRFRALITDLNKIGEVTADKCVFNGQGKTLNLLATGVAV